MPINKAVIIGGSNGIGLAISRKLIDDGCKVKILDISRPDENILRESECEYSYCDMCDLNEHQIEELAQNESINALIITAGIGRIADFRYFHTAEIEKTFRIDAVSVIKILKVFYDKLLTGGGGHFLLLRRYGVYIRPSVLSYGSSILIS